MGEVKLTMGERKLLARVAQESVAAYPRRGSSAQTLWLAGYAEWDDRAGGGKWWLVITPAGLSALGGALED